MKLMARFRGRRESVANYNLEPYDAIVKGLSRTVWDIGLSANRYGVLNETVPNDTDILHKW